MNSEEKNEILSVREYVDTLEEEELKELELIIEEKKRAKFEINLGPLPDFAHNEYKIFDGNKDVTNVTKKVLELRKRRYFAFAYYYKNPSKTDDDIAQFIQSYSDISYSQALRDIAIIKHIVGTLPVNRKELIRIQVIDMHKKAYQVAESKNDPIGMTAAANGISKAANLDKDDPEIPWDELLPPSMEPTYELEALGEGFEKRQNLERDIEKFKKKYGQDAEEAIIVNG